MGTWGRSADLALFWANVARGEARKVRAERLRAAAQHVAAYPDREAMRAVLGEQQALALEALSLALEANAGEEVTEPNVLELDPGDPV